MEVVDRPLLGIPEGMRAHMLTLTKRAMLNRAAAGIRGNVVIVNLPGKAGAVKECLGYILPEDMHAVEVAGDLNWWYWEEEDDETWNEPMRQAYQKEIAKIEGEEIDYAFFPLDSRQGEESVLGINYFMQHTNTKIVFPMHMWGYDILDKFLKNSVSEPYRERIMKVKEPGQSFYFEEER